MIKIVFDKDNNKSIAYDGNLKVATVNKDVKYI